MSESDISPASLPFNRYLVDDLPKDLGNSAFRMLHCIAAAKRILLQERVRDFNAADVVALADLIERAGRA